MSQSNPARPAKVWRCNCVKHCKGVLKQVSKHQYNLHAPHRVRLEDVLAHFVPVLPGGAPQFVPIVPVRPVFAPARRVHVEDDPSMPGLMDIDYSDSDDEDEDSSGEDDNVIAPPGRLVSPLSPARSAAPEDDENGPRPLTPPADPKYGYTEDVGAPHDSRRQEVHDVHVFINSLKTATLKNSGLSEEAIARMGAPRTDPTGNVTPAERVGLRMFCARGDALEENFSDNREAFMELAKEPIPTYEQVKRLVSDLTGIDAILMDMCMNTCVAYVGVFAAFEQCPFCGELRYDVWKLTQGRKVPRCTFQTYPLGPQLQAMWASPENARLMEHRAQETQRITDTAEADPNALPDYDDIYYGQVYIDTVQEEDRAKAIHTDDMVLMFSIDGAQLYESKASDCWFYVWVLFDLPPNQRYKKQFVLPGAVIGGPHKPKNIDSFIYPGLYHVAALQREGLRVWDASENRLFTSYLYLLLVTADGPAMAYLNGLVGHQGAHGCRLTSLELDHPDIILHTFSQSTPAETRARYQANLLLVESSRNNAIYARNRLQTGIAKPSIFSGLPRILGMPDSFGADLMHLLTLNLPDLVLGFLRSTLACEEPDTQDNWPWAVLKEKAAWVAHGKLVADATHCLPGSYDRPPRNPAEKISSGYKAWEWQLYTWGFLPGLLRAIQGPVYYRHFCKLAWSVRTSIQWVETLYYQRRRERLHFLRQSVHATTHIIPEITRLGPGTLYTQWTLENYIGNITREIKQHNTPYANVSECALRRCQVNLLKAMIPALADDPALPCGTIDLGNGYVLLHALDTHSRGVSPAEAVAILAYLVLVGAPQPGWIPLVRRWARLRLPHGQIARTAWKECHLEMRGRQPRRSCMVKLVGKPSRFAEVQYFFQFNIAGVERTLAMITPFTLPDPAILAESENTILACNHPGDADCEVIEVMDIASVVAMVPLPLTLAEAAEPDAAACYGSRFFVIERPGLDVAYLAGREEPMEGQADNI
ncbi:hypothetical protein VTO73DRAFT_5257 [Trametes versicolor]